MIPPTQQTLEEWVGEVFAQGKIDVLSKEALLGCYEGHLILEWVQKVSRTDLVKMMGIGRQRAIKIERAIHESFPSISIPMRPRRASRLCSRA